MEWVRALSMFILLRVWGHADLVKCRHWALIRVNVVKEKQVRAFPDRRIRSHDYRIHFLESHSRGKDSVSYLRIHRNEITYSSFKAFNQLEKVKIKVILLCPEPAQQSSLKHFVLLSCQRSEHKIPKYFFLNVPCNTAMNVTDFRDNAMLKLQVGGPFTGGVIDFARQEFILIQVEQSEQVGQQRRRRAQTVRRVYTMWSIFILRCIICEVLVWQKQTHLSSVICEQVMHNWTIPLHSERSDQILLTKTFAMLSRYSLQ